MQRLIEDQQADIQQKQQEIGRAKNFERDILPLLEKMITALERLIDKDMPFPRDDHRTAIVELNDLMKRADIPASEKFRQVLASYQDESDYGRTIESFRGEVVIDSGERVVDFLRVGRNILLYQALDGEHHAVWDHTEKRWRTVPNSWRREISRAIQIARKQTAPNLLILPMWSVSAESSR